MLTLRTKFTLALLLKSTLLILAIGVGSRWLILEKFNALINERAMNGFMLEIEEYYRHFGDWQTARDSEDFQAYIFRTRQGDFNGPGRPLRADRPPAEYGFGAVGQNPPQPSGQQPLPSGQTRPPPPREMPDGRLAPGIAVLDGMGRALLPLAGLAVGEQVSTDWRSESRPIIIDGQITGHAVVLETVPMTDVDQAYLDAIEQVWSYSLLGAILLALPVGILLSRHFTKPIQSLKQAMSAVQQGRLGYSIKVSSDDELGQLTAAFNRMSEDLAESHARLKELSRKDELTGLPNRRAFSEVSGTLIAHSRRMGYPLTVAIVDADHFKNINDSFSHSVGDRVLQQLASLFQQNIREVDMVARYGGEEFVFIFPRTGLQDAHQLCEKLRRLIQQYPWQDIARHLQVTISIGLAEHQLEQSLDDTISRADEKLYQAKQQGRDRVCS